jgi:hypothetical protein
MVQVVTMKFPTQRSREFFVADQGSWKGAVSVDFLVSHTLVWRLAGFSDAGLREDRGRRLISCLDMKTDLVRDVRPSHQKNNERMFGNWLVAAAIKPS